jgi:hypothetical protein
MLNQSKIQNINTDLTSPASHSTLQHGYNSELHSYERKEFKSVIKGD